MDYKKLGYYLKLSREKRDMTQNDISKKIGVTPQTISTWENGKNKIDIDNLIKLCEIYNIDFINAINSLNDNLCNTDCKNPTSAKANKLLTNYNKLDEDDQTKLVDYSDELVNSDKYKETVTISITARNGDTTLELTKEQYEEFIRLAKEKGSTKLPDGIV